MILIVLFFWLYCLSSVRRIWRLWMTADKQLKVDKTIDDLPDECLSKIFSYLDAVDRVRIERVCEKWRCMSRASWKEVKSLVLRSSENTAVFFVCAFSRTEVQVATSHFGIIRSIISRCGSFINALKLSDHNSVLSYYVLGIVAEYCHSLSRLELDVDDLHCKEIAPILMCNRKLKEFVVHTGGKFLKCLDLLVPEVLYVLSFENSRLCDFKYSLESVLDGATSLQYLKCDFVDRRLLHVISKISSLTHLNFRDVEIVDLKEDFTLCIKKLSNLQNICLNGCNADDDCIISLAENCHELRTLEICYDDSKITERGFAALSWLPKLTTFGAICVNELDVTCLQYLPSTITGLNVYGCDNVTDDLIIPQIYRLTNLRKLTLSQPITERTLEEAVTATKARTNGERLVIRIDAYVDVSKFNDKSPLLKVILWD